ncbi:hypothetical protein JOF46_002622 [Paeniglutamicibacter psychrophenolicus]|uniref:Uncharacterized protein n=1 Tax=Paeniglutamicibacter psychrophenolicus TaxID=257454 RepID=A0ABS4WEW5_9MICC|nr:hypothetical protein [Paeniglutamicibacter psychrophenolicus]
MDESTQDHGSSVAGRGTVLHRGAATADAAAGSGGPP